MKPQTKGSRNLLAYFVESKLWKNFYSNRTMNYAYWVNEDPDRARRMFAARTFPYTKIGLYVDEYIYEMLECVYTSKLKRNTKDRLLDEIEKLEKYHSDNKTIKQEI